MAQTRREFIRCCSLLTAAGAASFTRLGLINALAQSTADYKALVCVFLFGGNDGNNLLVPADTTGYGAYAQARGVLALPQSTLLQVGPASGGSYGFHARLTDFQSLFQAKRLAVLANCGVLVQPVTRAQYLARAAALPQNLFSHSDQQTENQAGMGISGVTTGWAGRVADKIQPLNAGAQFPTNVSVAGSSIFCNGAQTQPATVQPGAITALTGFGTDSNSTARLNALQQLLTLDTGLSLVQATSTITTHAQDYIKLLNAALANATKLTTTFPTTSIGNQLAQVAQIIGVRSSLGLRRQIFFASIGGFDTHTAQTPTQDNLFNQIGPALGAFDKALQELGVSQNVTTFTMSDFARTFQPNSSGDGSDHGWGNHQVIMGGVVKGGDLYGTFPTLALGGPDDISTNGRWIPTTSIDQYGSTLASWFGVADTDLPAVFPNLVNFATKKLAFV